MHIGTWSLSNNLALAPMAGVTDLPFRQMCRKLGAGLVVSEMVTSDTRLWSTRKSRSRLNHRNEPGPISVQIAGADPLMMADAARRNVELGAQIIDINMGCPAKKVCKRAAGSALLSDLSQVEAILRAVTAAVPVPVTLKIRTGPTPETRNAVQVARLAEDCGIAALAVHGRTRACRFNGDAEYQSIAEVVNSVDIPVFANGDIDSPEKAKRVLETTGAGGIMIGRAAQGNPWIFRDTAHYLEYGEVPAAPELSEVRETVQTHLEGLHRLYGDFAGTRIARKHLGWYCQTLVGGEQFRHEFNQLDTAESQILAVDRFFQQLETRGSQALQARYGVASVAGNTGEDRDGVRAA